MSISPPPSAAQPQNRTVPTRSEWHGCAGSRHLKAIPRQRSASILFDFARAGVTLMDLSSLEGIAKALEKSLDFWGSMLLLATALVVIGLVVEYWHDVQEFWVRLTWPMASFPWDKFTALVGGILVTIGVAGELLVTYKASRVETRLRENSHKIEALLTQKAGDAAASAKTAHDEADAVRKETDELTARLASAAKLLGLLEQDVRVQGPRWQLLEDNKGAFIATLKPFAGQRFILLTCGKNPETESFRLGQELIDFLGKQEGAGWELAGNTAWTRCTNGGTGNGGNLITFNSTAGSGTKDSATALFDILAKLKISTVKLQAAPQMLQPGPALNLIGVDSPWALAIKDPTVVVLLVGPNPMFDLLGTSKRHK